jgi:hypothetical protein
MTALEMQKLYRKFVDSGKLIEAGWISLRIAAISSNAPQMQIDEMRNAFMAGAQHLFASIMQMLEPGDELTENDMRRIDLIADELEAFGKDLDAQLKTEGNA